MDITEGKPAIYAAAETLKNWGRWGKDDQVGTLNHIEPQDIVAAAGLIRRGAVFALRHPRSLVIATVLIKYSRVSGGRQVLR